MTGILNNRLHLSLLVLVLWILIGWFGGPLLSRFGEPTFDLVGVAVPKTLLVVVVLLIAVSALFESREIGFEAPVSGRSLLLLWLPGLYAAAFLALAMFLGTSSDLALPLLISTTLGAVSQELMFRGILFAGLRSRFGIHATMWISSLVSGIAWLPVWIWYGAWEQGISDMVLGFLLGILFTAIRVRTASLYPCILLHVGWSYGLTLLRFSGEGVFWTQLVLIAIVLPLPIYGLFLLRQKALAKMKVAG